jgi:hypothetical protein
MMVVVFGLLLVAWKSGLGWTALTLEKIIPSLQQFSFIGIVFVLIINI